MSDLKSAIHPAALDLMLGSATNAAQKGQSQYSTPVELAAALALDLPRHRPVVIDLTCGPGNLLAGVSNHSTQAMLGMDVDPRSQRRAGKPHATDTSAGKFLFIQAGLTALYESMRQIEFKADLFVLNPPWSLNWHAVGGGSAQNGVRDTRLEGLADSEVPAVAKTFKAVREASDTIDSTLATLLVALDRLSETGEGFLIGYTSTLDRLIFAPGAIGRHLVPHIWKKVPLLSIAGMEKDLPEPLQQSTAIYFSASHEDGPAKDGVRPRFMRCIHEYSASPDTVERWKAVDERAKLITGASRETHNLTLRNNQIVARLGLFDTALTKVKGDLKKTAERLCALNGRNPMQVVMQRDERNFILGLFKPGAEWTVDPLLRDAVQAAVNQYNAARAPLVPLPKIQRLGYMDESDDILCLKDLGEFEAGRRYPLATRSVRFTRTQFKPSLYGEEEELELSGQELAIIISIGRDDSPSRPKSPRRGDSTQNPETTFTFMDASLREANVKIEHEPGANFVQFTLQELVDHFEIPEVPAIAGTDRGRHQSFIDQLHQLEQLTA